MTRSKVLRYNIVAVTLHWLIAAGIFANLAVGLIFSDLPRGAERIALFRLHVSIGLLVLILSILTLAWRFTHRTPALPAMPRWMRLAASSSHYLLYLAIVGIPLSGWLMVSASPGHGLPFFLFDTWPKLPLPGSILNNAGYAHLFHESFESLHVAAAWGLILLLPVHAAAALYHQYVLRDGVLARMVPWMKVLP